MVSAATAVQRWQRDRLDPEIRRLAQRPDGHPATASGSPVDRTRVVPAQRGPVPGHGLPPSLLVTLEVRPVVVVPVDEDGHLRALADHPDGDDLRTCCLGPVGEGEPLQRSMVRGLLLVRHPLSVTHGPRA